MKTKVSRRKGFTLIEVMIVVGIIGLLAAVAAPNYVRVRDTSHAKTCVENMRQIDSAIQQWALERGIGTSEAADVDALKEYLNRGKLPKCPTGEEYVFSPNIGSTPTVTCPIGDKVEPNHVLPEALQ